MRKAPPTVPGGDSVGAETATPETKPPPQSTREESTSAWTASRIVGLVLAGIGAVVGLVMLIGGLSLVAAAVFVRDDDGFYTSETERLQTDSYAITAEEIDLGADPIGRVPEEFLGTVQIRAEAAQGEPIFVGIGAQSDVATYLRGVDHATIADFGDTVRYDDHPGGAPRRPPGAGGPWIAQVEGKGEQTLRWDSEGGVWAAVVMNADGSRGVAVDADAGVEFEWFLGGGLILSALGLLLLALAVIAGLAVIRRASHGRAPQR